MNPPLISCTAGAFVEPETKEIVIKEKPKPKPKPKPNELYPFFSFTFHAGSAGAVGPTLEQIREKYGTGVKFWTNNDDYFSMDSKRQGIQIWTVPKTGYYKFDVYGAGGVPARYGRPSGYSRKLSGYVELNMNEKIHIACGQNAKYHQDQYASFYGGHGGTFVVKEDGTPLIITGGGSGAINQNAKNPVIQTHGNNILTTFNSEGASYSTDMYGLEHKADGHGGDYVHSSGASGAGFYSDGKAFKDRIDQKNHTNAKSWKNGLKGGVQVNQGLVMSLSEGGFGGGAVTISSHLFIAGGGGGYSGGQGALENSNFPGGAGGSYYDPNLVKNFTVGPKYSGKGKVFVKFRPEYIGEEALYPFKSFTFNTGKYTTGRHGPDLENVREIYAKEDSTLWTNNDDYFSMNPNRQGIQIWTVPKSGMYQFNVYGPSGKDPQNDNLKGYRSGYGYNVYGDVYLIANEKIHIACGQYGDSIITQSGTAVGGSGGTFVVKEDDTPLIIVGGASGLLNGYGGTFNGKGTQSSFYSNGVAWSTNESGGAYLNDGRALGSGSTNNSYGQNGAGFYADADSLGGLGWSPKGWVNGLTGGEVPGGVWYGSGYHQVVGGFGGGGASFIDSTGYVRSGAGGGYSGGGGSYFWNYSTGGAGVLTIIQSL